MLAGELIELIRRQPRSGQPKHGYIEHLCRLYPEPLLRSALSTAKADYQGKINRVIATRYDQLAESFLSMVHIASARYWLKSVDAA